MVPKFIQYILVQEKPNALFIQRCFTSDYSQEFATLLESLRHDAVAIIAQIQKNLDFYLTQRSAVKIINFVSDGPTTQYRNLMIFNLVTQYLPRSYPQLSSISSNFSKVGHGKSPADGIDSSLKEQADDKGKYGHYIPDFETFDTTLRLRVKATHIDVVTRRDIETIDAELLFRIDTFGGTMKVYQYTWSKNNPIVIFFNSFSCFYCYFGDECKHLFMGTASNKCIKEKLQPVDEIVQPQARYAKCTTNLQQNV